MGDLQTIQWKYAHFYRQLQELPATDRPADEIINDDYACDRWYSNYVAEMARRSAKGGGGGAAGGRQVAIPEFTG